MVSFLIICLVCVVLFSGAIPRLIARIDGRPVQIKGKTWTVRAYIPYGKKRGADIEQKNKEKKKIDSDQTRRERSFVKSINSCE